ncbi:hypothetical protein [Muricoccus radiodurans]|uniref:hypothetical protein n=1 Tax=Muricoccus radiodurans TaxID=2231721 RepID=UPI003CF7CCE7
MRRALLFLPGAPAALFLLLPLLALPALAVAEGGWGAAWPPLGTSLALAGAAGALALILGGPAAFGLWRWRLPGRAALLGLLAAPLLLPATIWAAALRGLPLGPAGPVLAGALLGAPVVALCGWAALSRIDGSTLRAAAVLGAEPRLVWRRLVLPRALPGLGTGTLLAAALALAEPVLIPSLAPAGMPLLSRAMLDAVRNGSAGAAAATGTALLLLTVLLLLAAALLRRAGRRAAGG